LDQQEKTSVSINGFLKTDLPISCFHTPGCSPQPGESLNNIRFQTPFAAGKIHGKICPMKTWQKILIGLTALSISFVGLAAVRFSRAVREPEEIAFSYLQSGLDIVVENTNWITFSPADRTPTTGLIFYPGSSVSPEAYAPPLYKIAAQGFFVVTIPMPLGQAVFGYNQAVDVIAAYPEIKHWVIGGHSLGGAMSARFVSSHPGLVSGLVFWAAYPTESDALQDTNVQVLSIYGTADGLVSQRRIENSVPLLPADTIWIEIEGGNHAQFGYYGPQNGDNPASISRDAQQAAIIAATVEFLASINQ